MGRDLKKIWSVAFTEWIKWICNPRMIIVPMLILYIYTFAIEPLMARSVKMESPLNLLEPLIAIGNSGQLALIMPIVFMNLMGDFPKIDGCTMFMISRTGRKNWFYGQLLFAVMSIVTYLGSIYIVTTAFIMNKTFFANGWSMVVKKFDVLFPEEAFGFASELVPGNLYNHMTPFSAAVQTYALMFMYLLVIVLIMLLFNLKNRKVIGFAVAVGIIVAGTLFCSVKSDAMWIFPMANAITWLHFTDIYKDEIFPVYYSYIYFGVITAILLVLNVFAVRKANITEGME